MRLRGCLLLLPVSLLLTGCLTSESCTKIDGPGVNIEIGCDDVVMQPITRAEELNARRLNEQALEK